jgi:putative metal-binding protein
VKTLCSAASLALCACTLVTEADTDRLGGGEIVVGGCDRGCDDGVDCTVDSCDQAAGQCRHEPDSDSCGGSVCDPEQGCQPASSCGHDEDCNDPTGCNVAACHDHQCVFTAIDGDHDGATLCGGDCNDGNTAVAPGVQEVCGDGLDNDCSGQADGNDPSCADPCGADQTIRNEGDVEGDTHGLGSSNSDICQRAAGPEALVRLVLEADSDVTLATDGSDFDTVLYVRDSCDGAEIGCSDNRSLAQGWLDSRLWLKALPAGTYYVVVDAADRGGHYQLRVQRSDPQPRSCTSPLDITGGGTAIGATAGDSHDEAAPCSNGSGPEDAFTFEIGSLSNVTLDSTDSEFDVVQDVRQGETCDGNSLPGWCLDGTNGGEAGTGLLAGGRYTVLVDGWAGASGRYVLRFFP